MAANGPLVIFPYYCHLLSCEPGRLNKYQLQSFRAGNFRFNIFSLPPSLAPSIENFAERGLKLQVHSLCQGQGCQNQYIGHA